MGTPWIELGGLTIEAPVTALTNLLLTAQGLVYARWLRAEGGPRRRRWGDFFLMMAIATLAGAVKHGMGHELSRPALYVVLWTTNLAGGLATYSAQRAFTESGAHSGPPPRADSRVPGAQLFVFLALNLALGPRLVLLLANVVAGFLPMTAADLTSRVLGRPGAGHIAGALSFSALAAAVYAAELSAGSWLNHVDIAHLLMSVTLWLLVCAVREGRALPRRSRPGADGRAGPAHAPPVRHRRSTPYGRHGHP